MLLYFPTLFYAVIFFLGLQIITHWEGSVFYVLGLLILFSIFVSRKLTNRWIFSIIPVLFLISSLGLLYLIDSYSERQIFNIVSAGTFYLAILGGYRLNNSPKDKTANGMLATAVALTMFFFYSASYGIYLNFAIPLWILMLSYYIVTFAVSYQYFKSIDFENKKSSFNYSMLLGFVMLEIAWMINFWPFGYLTTGVILLIFYYILWDLTQSYFLDVLSKRRVLINIIFLSFLVGSVLSSSKWFPSI